MFWTRMALKRVRTQVSDQARATFAAVGILPGAVLADLGDLIELARLAVTLPEALDLMERAEEEAEGFYRDQQEQP